jgi:addiction module RelB/DinJ family antitoxin
VFSEIGMDMTTAIDSFLRTVAREGRIPFDLRTERACREAVRKEYIRAELEKSKLEASDPNTV